MSPFEQALAEAVRTYLAAPPDDSERLGLLGSRLGRLADGLLDGADGWPEGARVDGARVVDDRRLPGGAVELTGDLLWALRERSFADPFRAVLLVAQRGTLAGWELELGDARTGIGRFTPEARRSAGWNDVPAWVFAFRGG